MIPDLAVLHDHSNQHSAVTPPQVLAVTGALNYTHSSHTTFTQQSHIVCNICLRANLIISAIFWSLKAFGSLPVLGLQEALPDELLASRHQPGLCESQPLHLTTVPCHLHSTTHVSPHFGLAHCRHASTPCCCFQAISLCELCPLQVIITCCCLQTTGMMLLC